MAVPFLERLWKEVALPQDSRNRESQALALRFSPATTDAGLETYMVARRMTNIATIESPLEYDEHLRFGQEFIGDKR